MTQPKNSTSSPATIRRRSTSSPVLGDQLGNLLRNSPEWLEDSTEKLVDDGVSAPRDTPASTSRESDSRSGIGQAQYPYSLSNRSKSRSMLANQNDKVW